MPHRRLIGVTAMGLALLTGCATGGTGRSADQRSTEDILAALPPEQRAPITDAENAVREAERQAARAEEAVRLAEQRLKEADAEVDARKANVEKAKAQLDLVRAETKAQLEGVPVGGQVPAEAQAAQRRLQDAQYGLEVAQWELERAQALLQLRRAERAYAEPFRKVAQEQVEVKKAEADLVRAQVAARVQPSPVAGAVDPRVAEAEAKLREAQADFARARAEAAQRLADVQLQRRTMARFQSGPPPRLSQAGPGRSGAQGLASQQKEVEPEPLPWPSAWQPGAEGQSGAQGGGQPQQGTPAPR